MQQPRLPSAHPLRRAAWVAQERLAGAPIANRWRMERDERHAVPPGVIDFVERRFAAKVEQVVPLAADLGGQTTAKAEGYGAPVRLDLRRPDGSSFRCVFRLARPNAFGHERRSDRAQQQLLAWDTFHLQSQHLAALDVGAVGSDGALVSWADAGEPFLITDWAEGTPYADDLRKLAHGDGPLQAADVDRAEALARHLASLHHRLSPDSIAWERSLRDTVGSGEGLFGIADAYGVDSPWARKLVELEQAAARARWPLKRRAHRLSRTHGDFHPFNIVFTRGTDFTALDASRGGCGEPADDLTALALNYVFFALEHRQRWPGVFQELWKTLWRTYLAVTGDLELLDCCGLFLAWRAVVVACPKFYPQLSERSREALLDFAAAALSAGRFEPDSAERIF